MKVRTAWTVGIWWLLLLSAVVASPAKDKQPAYQNVDAGSFGVFMNGHRVATEKFSILQNASGSVATSEFKTDIATAPALQTSELELAPNGDLRKYEWKEVSPGKARAVITPNDNLLVERSTNTPQDKEEEHPFLLPLSRHTGQRCCPCNSTSHRPQRKRPQAWQGMIARFCGW